MTYPVTKLITGAYYESGIVARGLGAVSGPQASDGLDLLNEVIIEKSMDSVFLPYWHNEEIEFVTGQETYDVPGLIEVATLTFNIGNVRYPMDEQGIREYNGTGRVSGFTSLPDRYYLQRTLGGMDVKFYPSPSSNYVLNILGKFSYPEITNMQEDMSLTYDRFHLLYLKFKLAYRLLIWKQQAIPPKLDQQLNNMEQRFHALGGQDFTVQKTSSFGMPFCGPNYMRAALKDGWYPTR